MMTLIGSVRLCAGAALGLLCAMNAFAADRVERSVRLEWEDACDTALPVPYFELSATRSGSVRYGGTLWGQRKWSHRERVGAAKAQALIRAAIPDSSAASTESKVGPKIECGLVRVRNSKDDVVESLPLDGARARSIEGSIAEMLARNLVECSSREFLPKECGGVVVSLSYSDDVSCGAAHVLNLYSSGLAHYFTPDDPKSDRYVLISPSKIILIQHDEPNVSTESLTIAPPHRYYATENAIALKTRVTSLTGLEFPPVPLRSNCTPAGRPFANLWINP